MEYLIPMLDHFFNLTKKSNYISRRCNTIFW